MRSIPGSLPRAPSAAAILGWLLLALPLTAHAHGVRLPFEQWGGFSAGAVRCQRTIARAAARCAGAGWGLRRACLAARVAGEPCDETATVEAIAAIRRAALDDVDARCSELQAIELQYLGSFDLQADVTAFCRAWETAAASAVFGPVSSAVPLPPDTARCVTAAAAAATDAMQLVFRTRRACMDRIASVPLDAPKRGPLLDLTVHRLTDSSAAVAARLTAHCAAAEFSALYGRSPAAFVDGLAQRADCIGGSFYIQTAVLCPAAVCGNGIVELDESCDDGNTADGDNCPADCR